MRPPADGASQAQKQSITELREHAAGTGTRLQEVRTSRSALGQGRTAHLLAPVDAARLYQNLHTAAVAVFVLAETSVRLRPHETPHWRAVQPLGDFVRYKAAFVHVTRPGDPGRAWDEAAAALGALGWEDANDPRILPMHCFDPACAHDLSEADGWNRFDDAHRRREQEGRRRGGWHWANGDGHEWAPAKARHALEPLALAGRDLPQGLHWDTKLGRTREFSNGWQVYDTARIPYINVAPNAHVRAPDAQKTWDAEDEPPPEPRAPQVGRRVASLGVV